MRDKVKAILERELERINNRSETRGLELDDFRTLDLLIKACKSFTAEAEPPATPINSPSLMSPEQLLQGLKDDQGPV